MTEFTDTQVSLGRRTGFAGWWERMDLTEEAQRALEAAGRDTTISHRAISIVLGKWGYEVSVGQVGHWRRTVLRVAMR